MKLTKQHFQILFESLGSVTLGVVVGLLALNINYFSAYWVNSGDYQVGSSVAIANASLVLPANHLYIPKLKIDAPIQFPLYSFETDFQKALQSGVVHYPGSAEVGKNGNAYIFGHSSDFYWTKGDFKNVFAKLPELELNDEIIVTNGQGQPFTYSVITHKIVEANDQSVLLQDPLVHNLTLQTSYPLGTALRRYIVVAELKIN